MINYEQVLIIPLIPGDPQGNCNTGQGNTYTFQKQVGKQV